MPNDPDILGKANALLKKHAAQDGSDVPMLTELIEEPRAPQVEVPSGEITKDVLAHVVAEVEARIARRLEKRLIEQLEPQLHAAVASALGDLRQELANAIGDAITEALRRRPVK